MKFVNLEFLRPNFKIFLSFQTLTNVLKAAINVTVMQLVTTLWDHTTAHVVVSMKEMEKIAKKSSVSYFLIE